MKDQPFIKFFLEELYKEPELASSESIIAVIRTIQDLISTEEYDIINQILSQADTTKIPSLLLNSLLRTSGHVRKQLSWWNTFLKMVYYELKYRGYDPKEVLKSLLEEEGE
jgi:hypothetical protein